MTNPYKDRPYEVGKGKPPVHTQFGKDRPGNRNGRPRGSRNADTLLKAALAARMPVKDNGRSRSLTKLEVAITQLVNKAASGDMRAIETVLRMNRDMETRLAPQDTSRPLNDADRAVLERFAEQIRDQKGGQP